MQLLEFSFQAKLLQAPLIFERHFHAQISLVGTVRPLNTARAGVRTFDPFTPQLRPFLTDWVGRAVADAAHVHDVIVLLTRLVVDVARVEDAVDVVVGLDKNEDEGMLDELDNEVELTVVDEGVEVVELDDVLVTPLLLGELVLDFELDVKDIDVEMKVALAELPLLLLAAEVGDDGTEDELEESAADEEAVETSIVDKLIEVELVLVDTIDDEEDVMFSVELLAEQVCPNTVVL